MTEPDSPANPEREQTPADRSETAQSIETPAKIATGAASKAPAEAQTHQGTNDAKQPGLTTLGRPQDTGDIPSSSPSDPPADEPATRATAGSVMSRLKGENRWFGQIEFERDDMMKMSRKQFTDKKQRQQWVYGELDRMYPPLTPKQNEKISHRVPMDEQTSEQNEKIAHSGDGSIQGLSSIPKGWPELSANASLAAELGWVQANRLRVVTEKLGKPTLVDLGKALSPAPSWSALGWLETSIRSYAKFVDVAAKVTGGDEGEAGVMRRERVAVDEVHGLLREMIGADVCPTCGKPV